MAQGQVVIRNHYGCPRNIGFRDMRTGTLYAGSMVACRDGSDMIEEPTVRADLRVMGITPGSFGFTTTADRAQRLQVDTGTYGPFTNSAGADAITAADIDKVCFAIDGTTVARLGVTEADLVALVNEIRTDYIAHIASVVFHTVADTNNQVTLAAATNTATAIALINEIRDDYEGHRQLVDFNASTVHDVEDAVNAIDAPAATTASQALALALDIKAKYNAHLSQLGVHIADDAVNVVAATATGRSPAGYVRYVLDNGGVMVDFEHYENLAAMRIGGIL